jgi:hypothetical protein
LVLSLILSREAELVVEADAGQKESELAVVRVLPRLIFSPNVRMPLSRLAPPLRQAIARHMAAQAALNAVPGTGRF